MNRLLHEKSPYLLQHADNPVEWYPWGEEAFAEARREEKPVFLSIGYSTCHWCHVMAHESFENERIAAIMNREFVNIKVDREERPDVDRVYMTFVQATTGHGGWPMSVWLTPDLKPFVGGTYFPPSDRNGQPGFPTVLERIAQAWKQNAEKIAEQGTKIIAALREASGSSRAGDGELGAPTLEQCYQQFTRSYDAHEGGFGGAPKFPRPVTLNFLLRFAVQESAPAASREHALEMVLFTLSKMARGGLHDHLGGGFHRYAVDASWHIPHFEKMLYDQAQLAASYLDAFQLTRQPLFGRVARDTLEYVRRDMTARDGGFYSAEDADSEVPGPDAPGAPKKKSEGAFYVWTQQQIEDVLENKDAAIFAFHYGVQPNGNAPSGTDPHGEFTGQNILIERHDVDETASEFGLAEAQTREILERGRRKLFELRTGRPRPHLDDKIITAWNGLMISAFARAAQVFGEDNYLETGVKAAAFIRAKLYQPKTKTLLRNYREGPGNIPGFAEDYAFMIQALLDLYEADLSPEWLSWAGDLQEMLDREFYDEETGGYFNSTGKDQSVLLRMKEDSDSAEPAPSSIATLNLLRLAQIRDDAKMRQRAEQTMLAFGGILSQLPSAIPQLAVALDFSLAKPQQIVIAGKRSSPETRALLREAHRPFLPRKVVLHAEDGAADAVRAMRGPGDRAAAYVCENFTCRAPVTDPEELAKVLEPVREPAEILRIQ